MKNKYGSYIQKLMLLVIDKDQEQFVKDIALEDLKQVNNDLTHFLLKHTSEDVSGDNPKQELLFD